MPSLSLPRRFHRDRPRTRGQSLVEFALLLPVFMLLFATTLDLGRLALAQLSVSNAAREGAFQASKTPTSFDSTQACPADASSNLVVCRIQLEAKNSGVTITPADIAVSCSDGACATGLGNYVTVDVVGHFQLLTPILSPFFGGTTSITFVRSATNQIETLPDPATTPAPTAAPTPTPDPSGSPTPTATPVPTAAICTLPSAGFTYTVSPTSMDAPVTMTVADTTTSPNCQIQSWFWSWGDNTTSIDQSPPGHTYSSKGIYFVTLTVTNAVGSNTTGKVQVHVK